MLKEIEPFAEENSFPEEVEKYIKEKGLITAEEFNKKNSDGLVRGFQNALEQQEILKTISCAAVLYDSAASSYILIQTAEGVVLLSPWGIGSSIHVGWLK